MAHVASFSTGLSSAIMVDRLLQRYKADDCYIVAMNTHAEHPDNWRFARECQDRWHKEIIVLSDGRTPQQVGEDKHIIPNQKIAPCTFELKIKPFQTWLRDTFSVRHNVTIHIGYDIFEAHRCKATEIAYREQGYKIDFPLLWKPIEHRPYDQVVKDDWGIEPPLTYKLGFPHGNCLHEEKGGCFKMGQGDWLRYLIHFPQGYANKEDWEQRMRQHPTRANYAILRDQSNGTVTPLTLQELRERYQADRTLQPSLFDQKSPACHYCGIGDLSPGGTK